MFYGKTQDSEGRPKGVVILPTKNTPPAMNPSEAQFPPLAQALGRLRQPRPWPYAPRPALARPATAPEHDLLRLMPEPALTGELPEKPRPAAAAIPGPEAARTYWFDL